MILLAESRVAPAGVTIRLHQLPMPFAIATDRDRRTGNEIIWHHHVRDACVVDAQHQQHRCRLRAVIEQFVAYSDQHGWYFRRARGKSYLIMDAFRYLLLLNET
jgi:hypothetical protein